MKIKKKQRSVYILLTVLMLSACSKNYQEIPIEITNIDYAFDATDPSGKQAEAFLASLYATLPLGYNRVGGAMSGNIFALNDNTTVNGTSYFNEPLDAATDDAIPSQSGNAVDNVSNQGYTIFSNPDNCWANSYIGIRKANIFLANYTKIPWAVPNKLQWYGAEARFLRAFFYFELIKRYGGVILLGDQVLGLNDDLDLPRSSFDACVSYMVSELDAVKDLLRPDPLLASDIGRISKGAAYALKAKVLLYAASPLNNPNNSLAKWGAAADAAQAVMALGLFSLEPVVSNVFSNLTNREMIFYRMNAINTVNTSNALEYALSPVGYTVANVTVSGKVSPSQDLVDAFGMANGKAINESGSGYNAVNPYAGRDPRLTTTVFFNGQTWLNRAVETFVNGKDNPSSGSVKTRTGYYQRKFLPNYAAGATFSAVNRPWPYIRYTEILLDYAEARNEFSGSDASINAALVLLRVRAGIPASTASAGVTNYGIPPIGSNQSVMRDFIRNERRVELAFEEQRFWDLRRWKTAEAAYANGIHGMQIVKNADGTLTYNKVTVRIPFFQPRMYLYPIPNGQVVIATKLTQNPGW